ncbi:MAG: hypothetical protein WD510_00930, partial [Balneolaceae bacterium]
MINWIKSNIDEEDRFGFGVTIGIHLVLLIIALLYQFRMDVDNRPAYIDVTLGEFQSGTIAERAEIQPEEVATRPNPAETQPEDPDPEVEDPVESPQEVTDETAKQVELSEQTEDIQEEVIRTPETDRVDPEVRQTEEQREEVVAPPQTREDEEVQDGEETSGDERGTEGDVNVDQGTGRDDERSAPYDLRWEGDLERSPMIQPLPENTVNLEAVITVRFEVHPDGTIGRVIPLRKMNPELEREVMRTLRSWRFSRLPSGAPQEPQWGTITFR